MGSCVTSRKIVLLLFSAIIRMSHPHSLETFNDERNYDLEAIQFTTPVSKISEDDIYEGVGTNFINGPHGRYLTNTRGNVNGQDGGQSWSTKAKQRWAENSMSVWGKRNNVGQVTRSSPHLRRMWSENSMAVWGKRTNKPQLKETTDLISSPQKYQRQQPDDVDYDFDVKQPQTVGRQQNSDQASHKRRWAENSMSVWGKRAPSVSLLDRPSTNTDNSALQVATKELSAANSYPMNTHPDQERLLKILHRKHWEPKRNWATNTMNVWGKRENQEDFAEDIISDRSTDA